LGHSLVLHGPGLQDPGWAQYAQPPPLAACWRDLMCFGQWCHYLVQWTNDAVS
jgi:hypothetical protein